MVDIIQSTRQMVTEYMASFDSSHDMYHVERVVDLALLLAKETDQGLDKEVVQLAALCHDVGDRKYYQGKETGGSLVESFLKKQEYPKASLVGRIVDHIGFSKELGWDDSKDPEEQVTWRNHCLELHVVQDADKLDALGAFGIMRCAAFSGSKNIPLYVHEAVVDEEVTQASYLKNKNQSSIAHFHEKLFKLQNMMRTGKGRRMAIERSQFMEMFVKQVEDEYSLLK